MRISEMKNIGVVNEEKLAQVGIVEPEQLRDLGTEGAFLKIRHLVDEGACLHLLYGLEGAIQDIPKRELSERRKAELRDFFKQLN
ncbi:TfoX/Sxy family DNA transformation protein [Enterococcus gilvus]|uniref:TfoX/Sxy family DNA transformation protein n=1 Tax=Enterococcus gilvus TaxID=160453 RepID=UPI00290F6A11|nr:TfoX/Sxy family DNA transformation protein [Enterococcus gilvus]MDU5509227.1 TfoX/Sxy family DNA transformation protein [Enterococcus gilvus]